DVAVHPEVVVVAHQPPLERGVLLLDRPVPMASAIVGDGRDGPSEARPARLEARYPSTCPAPPPVKREAAEVEARRSLALRLIARRATKEEQAGLVRMQLQPVPLESLRQHLHHPLRVVLSLEGDHEVIRVPDQARSAPEPRSDVVLEPKIEHVVEI